MKVTVLPAPAPPMPPRTFALVLSEAEARHLFVISNWYKKVVDTIPHGSSPARNFSSRAEASAFLLDMFGKLQPLIEP